MPTNVFGEEMLHEIVEHRDGLCCHEERLVFNLTIRNSLEEDDDERTSTTTPLNVETCRAEPTRTEKSLNLYSVPLI